MNTNFSISIPMELAEEIKEKCEELGLKRSVYISRILAKELSPKIQELISEVKKYISMFEEDGIPTMPLVNILEKLEYMLK